MARRYSSDVNSAVSQSNRPESTSQPDETAYDNRGIQQTVTIFWSARSQLWLIALLLVLAMGTWFLASAVTPALIREWQISEMQALWLTAAVQAGFVVGAVTSAVLNLSDRISPQIVAGWASLGAT